VDSDLCECQFDPFSVFALSINRLPGFVEVKLNLSDAKQQLGCRFRLKGFLLSSLMEDQKSSLQLKTKLLAKNKERESHSLAFYV